MVFAPIVTVICHCYDLLEIHGVVLKKRHNTGFILSLFLIFWFLSSAMIYNCWFFHFLSQLITDPLCILLIFKQKIILSFAVYFVFYFDLAHLYHYIFIADDRFLMIILASCLDGDWAFWMVLTMAERIPIKRHI